MSEPRNDKERRALEAAKKRSDDPDGVAICHHCRRPYHKSYGPLCGECSGAGTYD